MPSAKLTITSTLPLASGMSSSSALMIAAALALANHAGFTESELWRENIATQEDLATYLATIENGASFRALEGKRGVGTFGGSQDHTAIICCLPNQVSQYSFRGATPTLEDTLPWDPSLALVVAVSGVAAEKTGGAQQHYNRLAELTAEIRDRWNAATGRTDVNVGQAIHSAPGAEQQLRELLRGEPELERRYEQFVTESRQCIPTAAQELRNGDLDAFGDAVGRSQKGAEEGLQNQVEETAFLVRDAVRLDAAAASAFGAGVGGSVWALVPEAQAEAFAGEWLDSYVAAYPQVAGRATTLVTRPHGGAHPIE